MAANGPSEAASSESNLQKIPIELILEILSRASAFSQATYRTLLLVSGQFNHLVRAHCLESVPIALETHEQHTSFDLLLHKYPDLCARVRHLWIFSVDDPGNHITKLIFEIIKLCTGIVSLTCAASNLAALYSSPTFEHAKCSQVALYRFPDWDMISTMPHSQRFCCQITHLRIQNIDSLKPAMRYLTQLQYLAFSYSVGPILNEVVALAFTEVPTLRQLVIITKKQNDITAGDSVISALLAEYDRLCFLYCSEGERDIWAAGVRGGFSIWDQAARTRTSMKVFRDVLEKLTIS